MLVRRHWRICALFSGSPRLSLDSLDGITLDIVLIVVKCHGKFPVRGAGVDAVTGAKGACSSL